MPCRHRRSETLEILLHQLSPKSSYDPIAPTQTSSTQTNIPSQSTFDSDLEDADDQDDIANLSTEVHTPHSTVDLSSISSLRHHKPNTHQYHVHVNPDVKIFLIPKRFCTFTFIRSPKQKRNSWKWKHIAQTDCEQVKLNPTVFKKAVSKLKFKQSADMFASSTHHQLPRYYSKITIPKQSAQTLLP